MARLTAGYNGGDVTKYIRYSTASGVSYGTLEGDTVHQMEGGLFDAHTPTGVTLPLSSVKLLYPCEPGKILAVGLNYRSHLGTRPQPPSPEMFYKPVTALQNPGDPIEIRVMCDGRSLRGRDGRDQVRHAARSGGGKLLA